MSINLTKYLVVTFYLYLYKFLTKQDKRSCNDHKLKQINNLNLGKELGR